MTISIVLRGDPRGKGRHRSRVVIPKIGAPFVHLYPDPVTVSYEKALALAATVAMKRGGHAMLTGAIEVTVTAVMPVPNSWPKKKRDAALSGVLHPTSKPDWDNFAKILDALNSIVWEDDKNIVRGGVVKMYGESPCLEVKVTEIGLMLLKSGSLR